MTDSPTLPQLISRLEAEEPSRELDAEITAVLCVLPPYPPGRLGETFPFKGFPDGRVREDFDNGKFGFTWESTRLTSSIDAKLPGEDDGYWIIQGPRTNLSWWARYYPKTGTRKYFGSFATTEAMARRAAYLKSKLAEKEARDDG